MTNTSPAPIRAIVASGIVESLVYPHPDGFSLEDCFPPDVVTLIPNGVTVTVGMTFDGTSFGPSPPPPVQPSVIRQFTGTQFMAAIVSLGAKAFFDAAVAQTTKPLDAWYYGHMTPNDFYLENNAKLGRVCGAASKLGAAAVPPVTFTLASIVDSALTQ